MDRKKFELHLIMTLSEKGIDAKEKNYIIRPIMEEGKKYNSRDDFIRLNVFPPQKISNYVFDFTEIIQRFSIMEPYYPLWIDVCPINKNIVELRTSLRFRKPSEIQRKETGHPPFKLTGDNLG